MIPLVPDGEHWAGRRGFEVRNHGNLRGPGPDDVDAVSGASNGRVDPVGMKGTEHFISPKRGAFDEIDRDLLTVFGDGLGPIPGISFKMLTTLELQDADERRSPSSSARDRSTAPL